MTDRIIIRHSNVKSAATADVLRPIIGSWQFMYTKPPDKPIGPDHWLWRTRKRTRFTASGLCFTEEVKSDDS